MKEAELKVFLEGLVHYYAQTTGGPVKVEAPYLIKDIPKNLLDYTGRIGISGGYSGSVLFTAPHKMMVALMARYGQKSSERAYVLDLIGEIANIIAGNAREHFGTGFEVSTPTVARGRMADLPSYSGLKTYCIPVDWNKQQARLIIAVE